VPGITGSSFSISAGNTLVGHADPSRTFAVILLRESVAVDGGGSLRNGQLVLLDLQGV
jgi:hypothetical protein